MQLELISAANREFSRLIPIKRIRQFLRPRRETSAPLFVFGMQRSGTTLLLDILEKSLDTRIYHEANPEAFKNFRLVNFSDRQTLVAREYIRWVVFKPICDLQHADRLLNQHVGGKGVWIFRHYADVAESYVTEWDDFAIKTIRRIAAGRGKPDWIHERITPEMKSEVIRFSKRGLTPHSAAALLWYVRNRFYFDYELDQRDDDCLLVHYEALVTNPEAEVERMCDFLHIPYRRSFANGIHANSVQKNSARQIDVKVKHLCDALYERFRALL